MPANPVYVKTIVTTDMANKVAENYGVAHKDVLTGFKYIGEQILFLEKKHQETAYILGFEESYGYLSGSYVRDKDAVNGSFLIVEMFAYYKSKGISLLDKLNELYKKYGYYSNYLNSYEFEGAQGFKKMNDIMEFFRNKVKELDGVKIQEIKDYDKGIEGLPKSNVLKLIFANGDSVVVRPSGTEPKLKIYISLCGKSVSDNDNKYRSLIKCVEEYLK